MNLQEEKEILELEKSINEISNQLNSKSPNREKMQSIINKATQEFPNETFNFECYMASFPNARFMPLNQLSTNDLISRLLFYQSHYLNKLKSKSEEILNI